MARVPRTAGGKSSLARGIHRRPNSLFLLPDWRLCIVKKCVYTHIPDCVETVYELPLLPNNATSEIFLHKSEAVRSVDWILGFSYRASSMLYNKSYQLMRLL